MKSIDEIVQGIEEYFSMFDKQISEKNPDGTKTIKEKSWFNRGNMIIVQGMRSGDTFIPKKYASSGGHQLYKITDIITHNVTLKSKNYLINNTIWTFSPLF